MGFLAATILNFLGLLAGALASFSVFIARLGLLNLLLVLLDLLPDFLEPELPLLDGVPYPYLLRIVLDIANELSSPLEYK